MHDIIIIGAGTAGLTASIYARRAGKTVLVLERNGFGGQIVYSPKVENYPGYKEISGTAFADALMDQAMSLGAETDFAEVLSIEKKEGSFTVHTDFGDYECLSVIVAGGASHRHLGVEGEEELSGAGISYCALCDGAFYKNGTVAVVGGGDTALGDARFLSSICKDVYVIHRRDAFRAEARNVEAAKEKSNIHFIMDSVVSSLQKEDGRLCGISLKNVKTGEISAVKADGLFVAIGQKPATEAYQGLLDLNPAGYIIAGEDCVTSVPGIFVAGDIRTKSVRQLTTAVADGAQAAVAACAYVDEMK